MKIAVVYENIPEDTEIFLIDVTPEDWEWMKLTHYHFVNSALTPPDRGELCMRLYQRLQNEAPIYRTDGTPIRGKEQTEFFPIPMTGVDFLLHTGFIL